MSGLIENLLALARGDANCLNAALAPVDIAGMLRELCTQMQPAAQAKEITLIANIPDSVIQVTGDSTDLRRLFLILLDNAIKYTEAGSINLVLRAEGQAAKVTVTDSGIGMEPSALPHIFDRFWRVDKVRSRADAGAGLGLALASQIVENHGGALSVESEIGRGTTFTVSFNAASPA
jgi:signal transduction histidine kinase